MNNSELLTYIAKGTKITADIDSEQDMHLSGEVKGDINCARKFVLTPTGTLNGTVKAEQADISGNVDGEIRVKGSLSIQAGAHVKGLILAKKLQVHSGAVIEASMHTGPEVDTEKKLKAEPKSDVVLPEKDETESKEQRHHAEVLLSSTDNQINDEVKEALRNSATTLMNTLGFSLDIFDEEESDPFFQKFVFVKKSEESQSEIEKQYVRTLECLEASFLSKTGEPFPNHLYEACVQLNKELKSLQEYSVVIGDILLLRIKDGKEETVVSEIIPTELKNELKKNPAKIKDPRSLIGELQH